MLVITDTVEVRSLRSLHVICLFNTNLNLLVRMVFISLLPFTYHRAFSSFPGLKVLVEYISKLISHIWNCNENVSNQTYTLRQSKL